MNDSEWSGEIGILGYKRSSPSLRVSFVMSHQNRTLSEEDVNEIVVNFLDRIKDALFSIEKLQNQSVLSQKIVELELGVVSPLYHSLQRHLIDWGCRSRHRHTFGESLKLYEGKKYYEP